jgi:hypothetical protein
VSRSLVAGLALALLLPAVARAGGSPPAISAYIEQVPTATGNQAASRRQNTPLTPAAQVALLQSGGADKDVLGALAQSGAFGAPVVVPGGDTRLGALPRDNAFGTAGSALGIVAGGRPGLFALVVIAVAIAAFQAGRARASKDLPVSEPGP